MPHCREGKGGGGGGGRSVSTAPSLLTVNYTTVLVHVSSVFSCAACTCLHVRSHFVFR